MIFKPSEDRVLIEADPGTDKTSGGIFIPDSSREKPQKGIVRAFGPEVTTMKVDDKVLFGKYAGTEIIIDNEPFLIMRKGDVFGTYE